MNIKEYVKSLIYAITLGIISGLVMSSFKEMLPFNIYTIIVSSATVVIMSTYYPHRNPRLYSIFIPFLLSHYVSFVYCCDGRLSDNVIGISFIIVLVLLFIQILSIRFIQTKKESEELLFDIREKDLDNIVSELRLHKVLGINGLWGEGKTFLMHILKERLKNEYYFISINSLNVNIDKLHILILNEFDIIMKENGVFSKYSNTMSSFLDGSIASKAVSSVFSAFNYTESRRIDGLKNELDLLDKPILVVFEDIDRLDKVDTIIRIFSLANHIADYSDNIKIVYEYDSKVLHEVHCLNQLILEKYIPHDINIARLTFLDTLRGLFNARKSKYTNISLSDFEFMYKERVLYFDSKQRFSFIFLEQFVDCISVRRIKSFLDDINSYYIPFSSKKLSDDKNICIVYYFIKHFLPNTYNIISSGYSNLLQIFPIEWYVNIGGESILRPVSEKDLSIILVSNNTTDMDNFLEIRENKLSVMLLALLGYDFRANLTEDEEEIFKDDYVNIPIDLAKTAGLYSNKKIVSRLKHLHQPSYEAETKEERLVKDLKEMVFLHRKDNWKCCFNDFILKDLYYKDLDRIEQSERDNLIINRIGYTTLSMLFSHADLETWHNWIDLVFPLIFYKDKDILNRDLIVILLYCNMEEKSIFLKCIAYFNTIQVTTAFDDLKAYHKFFVRYISYICKIYSIKSMTLQGIQRWIFEDEFKDGFLMSSTLEQIKEEIAKRDSIISQEKETVIRFLDKNMEILVPFAGVYLKPGSNKAK